MEPRNALKKVIF